MSDAERATTALLNLMARLRDPADGCPWDREQTFATIAPYTLEEAYEVVDAIDRGDPTQLRDELGDLLFQVVFHSRMAQERGWFDFAAVATAIHDKLVRRHPHIFTVNAAKGTEATKGGSGAQVAVQGAGTDAANQSLGATAASDGLSAHRGANAGAAAAVQTRNWEALKALERAELAKSQAGGDTSALANVPKALPALVRAAKLGRRAARVGFDWEEIGQVRAKVAEELREVDEAVAGAATTGTATSDAPEIAEEIGDLLFAITNWTLHLKVDAEEALRGANAKFERRFRHMEKVALRRGAALESLSAAQWEELWNDAKRAERAESVEKAGSAGKAENVEWTEKADG
jgi:ATP diphosphatase